MKEGKGILALDLIDRYIKNKDTISSLRKDRRLLDCEVDFDVFSEQPCVLDLIYDNIEYDEMCDNCKKKHDIYLEIKKLSRANGGIMRRLRNLTQNLDRTL